MALQAKGKRRIDYDVVPLEPKHITEAIDILTNAFTGRSEPMCKGASPFEFGLLMRCVLDVSIIHKTTSVAIEKKTEKVIGVVVYNDMLFYHDWSLLTTLPTFLIRVFRILFSRHWDIILSIMLFIVLIIASSALSAYYDFELLSNEVYYVGFSVLTASIYMKLTPKEGEDTRHNFLRLLHPEIVEDLTADFKEERKKEKEYKLGTILECQLTAVHSDYLKCGVGTALKKDMIAFAKKNGFKYIVSEATNDYSQGQNKKIGFEVKKEIFYESYECPKKSGLFPWKSVSERTGFKKLCLMIYCVKK